MSTVERLQQWRDNGAITSAQFDAIAAIVRKERFSIFVELHALLYLGVLSFVAGLGWTVQKYFASLGDAAILIGLSTLLALSLYYCFSRAPAWSNARVESPNLAFDYVLYLACLVFAAELGYIESRFQLLGDNPRKNAVQRTCSASRRSSDTATGAVRASGSSAQRASWYTLIAGDSSVIASFIRT